MGGSRIFPWVILGLSSLATAAAVGSIEQSVSTSRQFIVYGTDVSIRGSICDFAEQTKRELLSLLAQRDNWTTAVVINAQYPRANLPDAPRLSVDLGQTGFGLKLQLDLVIDRKATRPEIRREILRAVVLEMAYRNQPNLPAGAAYISPPEWFLDGVPAEQSDVPPDGAGAVLATSAATNSVIPLEKFLAQRPELLDASGRTLYRAYAVALVDWLSHATDGPLHLTQFILRLPASSNDSLAELRSSFPELSGPDYERLWRERIRQFATRQPYHLMGSDETERRLEEMLHVEISENGRLKKYELTQFPTFLKRKSAKKTLSLLGYNLEALATRAHPVYAPIIAEYAEIGGLLLRGTTLDVPRRLDRMRKLRQAIAAQMHGIDDYLNWFEATSIASRSGEFSDYLKAAERAGHPKQTKRDPISVYLDALEAEYDGENATAR